MHILTQPENTSIYIIACKAGQWPVPTSKIILCLSHDKANGQLNRTMYERLHLLNTGLERLACNLTGIKKPAVRNSIGLRFTAASPPPPDRTNSFHRVTLL